jgi:fibronectin-binding autotransporter adhesin
VAQGSASVSTSSASVSTSSGSGSSGTHVGVSASTSTGGSGGSGGSRGTSASPRYASGSTGSTSRRADPDPTAPVASGGGGDDFVFQVPGAANRSFSAYIFFSIFRASKLPGLVPSFLLAPDLLGGGRSRSGKAGRAPSGGTEASGSGNSVGGTLGQAVHRVAGAAVGSATSLLRWLFVGLCVLVSALAATGIGMLARRRIHI